MHKFIEGTICTLCGKPIFGNQRNFLWDTEWQHYKCAMKKLLRAPLVRVVLETMTREGEK